MSSPEYYYGVICMVCGPQQLTRENYRQQMASPSSFWKCPRCGTSAHWDDARYDASCEAVYEHHMREAHVEQLKPLATPRTVAGFLTVTNEAVPIGKLLVMDYSALEHRVAAGIDMGADGPDLTVLAASYSGSSGITLTGRLMRTPEFQELMQQSPLGYKREPDA